MFFKKKKRNLIDDLELASKWVAKALNSSNYQADYSVESLKEIDRFFKEENRHCQKHRSDLIPAVSR